MLVLVFCAAFLVAMTLGIIRDIRKGSRAIESTAAKKSASSSDQAVTKSEIDKALSALGLASETVGSMSASITTLAHLNNTVNSLREDLFKEMRSKMPELALAYLRRQEVEDEDRKRAQATSIVIAQFNAPEGIIHPAFSTIAVQFNALRKTHWKKMKDGVNGELTKIESTHSNVVSADGKLSMTGCFMEVIRPGDEGKLEIVRVPYYENFEKSARAKSGPYDGTSRPRSPFEKVIDSFDPCRTKAEAEFWQRVARARIDRYVGKADTTSGGLARLEGGLLHWSRLLTVIESKLQPEWTKDTVSDAEAEAEVGVPALAELPAFLTDPPGKEY